MATIVPAPASQVGSISAGTTKGTLGQVVFSNSNGVSFGMAGQTITGSVAGATAGSVSAGTTNVALGQVVFSNSNGVSFGLNGSTVTATVQTNYLTTAMASNRGTDFVQATAAFAGTNASGTIASNGISVSVAAPGAAGSVSAGTTNVALGQAVFSNSNGVSFGLNGSTVTATVQTNYLTTAAQSNHSHGNPTLALTNLSGTTASASGGFTLSLSAAAAGGGGGITYSGYAPEIYGNEQVPGQQGQGTFFVQPMWNAPAFQFDAFMMAVNFSNASNSSGSLSITFRVGIYTRNVSTLSMFMSTSSTRALTMSGTAGSYSLFAGPRWYPIGWTTTLSASDYWVGIVSTTSTGGANMSVSQFLASQPNSSYSGVWGIASNTRNGGIMGQGVYTATTAGVPGSIAFTQISANASLHRRPPIFVFQSGTI